MAVLFFWYCTCRALPTVRARHCGRILEERLLGWAVYHAACDNPGRYSQIRASGSIFSTYNLARSAIFPVTGPATLNQDTTGALICIDFDRQFAVHGAVAMSSSALSLTARPELSRCHYYSLCCPQCGELRAAVETSPIRRCRPCPVCQQEVWVRFLGKGATVRPLPFGKRAAYCLRDDDVITTFWRTRKTLQPQAPLACG
jgi:hypothetical protein